jgi:hypothetical protein
VHVWIATILITFSTAAIAAQKPSTGSPANIKAVSERKGSIYATYDNGKVVQISKKGKYTSPKVAEDKRTVGYLDSSQMGPEDGLATSYEMDTSSILYICRDNKAIRKITSNKRPFIWNWKFRNNGKQVVLKTGYPHGLGWYELYDIEKNRLLKEAEETPDGPAPEWAQGM